MTKKPIQPEKLEREDIRATLEECQITLSRLEPQTFTNDITPLERLKVFEIKKFITDAIDFIDKTRPSLKEKN
jgi:hypothetical protein